jgi:hypothetical protein
MLRYLLLNVAALLLTSSICFGAEPAPAYTQKDLARQMLLQFGWNGGLPKDPADRDYLMILGGKRTFRYEAENAYNPQTDRVTVREFPLFGDFTGKGWILGVSAATSATFTVFLPNSGEYDFKAVIKGNGFIWKIADKEFRSDSKSAKFREIDITKVNLKAGVVVINLTIPPEGAIDSLSLTAPDQVPVQPLSGWRFKEKLTAVRLAETVVAMKNSFDMLPDSGPQSSPKAISVSQVADLPANVTPTNVSYLGPFSSTNWMRADYRGAALKIPINVSETGYYTLTANIMAENFSGKVNDTPFKLSAKPYLSKTVLGLYRLESGDNTLTINLPPSCGIDTIEFNKKSSTPDDFLHLAGVQGPADRLIGADEAAALLKNFQGSSFTRK